MTLVSRGFSRLALHALKLVLVPLETVRPRLYMRVYPAILKRYGMVMAGLPRYISSRAYFDDMSLITLGERTVISKHVIFLTHDYSVTTALIALGEAPQTDVSVHRPITVGTNVFIGMNVILMPGTTIGDNVIIGAGSVVRGSIPSGSIVTGNPGQVHSTIADRADRWRQLSTGQYATRDFE
jgi:carbonic anhydrase/acetyltransferase-like protein (isoleucine patch superfamily)